MSESLVFLNDNWLIPVIFCWSLLVTIFIWKEWSADRSRRFGLKVFLIITALTALALVAIKPALPEIKKEDSVVILTENYNKNQLDSLKQIYSNLKLIDYTKDESLKDIEFAKEIFVLGNGIHNYDLWAFEELAVRYLPGDSLSGIVKLNTPDELPVGDDLEVMVEYQNPTMGNRLVLENPAGEAMDSVMFQSKEKNTYKLSTETFVEGNFVYSISEKDSLGKTMTKNPLPIKITPAKTIRVLMMNAFPTFQMKYLKNFLVEQGHEIIVKNRITEGKYKFEFLNTERINLYRLTQDEFSKLDLIITDVESIKDLRSSEKKALRQSIEEDGLGLLILDEVNDINELNGLSDINWSRSSKTNISLDIPIKANVNTQPFRLITELGLEVIHEHQTGILSAYKRQQLGRVGTTVLRDTWQLQLRGQQQAYGDLWSELIEAVSKPEYPVVQWDVKDRFSVVNEPLSLNLRTSIANPKVLQNSIKIPLKQDFFSPQKWSGTIYPRETGWNSVQLENDSIEVFDYYVHSEQDWTILKAFQTQKVNQKFFNQNILEDIAAQQFPKPINPIWFFIVFLLSIGGLWLEPKL